MKGGKGWVSTIFKVEGEIIFNWFKKKKQLEGGKDGLALFNMPYLYKRLGLSNEFLEAYKGFDPIKSCLFYGNIFVFPPILQYQ